MNAISWCDRIIRAGFVLLFVLVPLLLTPWNYELFEYNKMMATYALTAVIVGAWIIKMVSQKELRIAKTPLDIPIALFFISQLVSAFFSMDHHVSWFGYYSRFNGGMWSITSYILLFYAFVSNFGKNENNEGSSGISMFLKAMIASGTIVAIYGVLERMGIDKHLWVQDVQNRVFSSLGQPNWLAAYIVSLIPITIGFVFVRAHKDWKFKEVARDVRFVPWIAASVLFFTVLLFTRSRSGLVGLAVADILFWGLTYWKSRDWARIKIPFLILHGLFALIVFINGTSIDSIDKWVTLGGLQSRSVAPTATEEAPSGYTAPLLEYGGTESGTIRKYVWQGAITAWQSSPKTMLIGTGTETFAFAFYQYRPREHNLTSEWDFLYNKAHNEYLNYLTTTGVFGLGSYLLIIAIFAFWFVRSSLLLAKSKFQPEENNVIATALFAGWASILVTNFFGFSVVLLQLFFFLFPALLLILSGNVTSFRAMDIRLPRQTIWVLVLLTAILLFFIGRLWWGDFLFAKGYRNTRTGLYSDALASLEAAIAINPNEPLYHDEAASANSLLAATAIEQQDATAASTFARESILQSDLAIRISPRNVNYWKTRTKILYALAPFDPAFTKAAITALETAGNLSPNDPKILYNLAVLYGQEGDNAKAIELLTSAIDLKPNYRDAYWALSIFYNETNERELAKSILNEYLTMVDPNDSEIKQALSQ